MSGINVTIDAPSGKHVMQQALEKIAGEFQDYLNSLQPEEIKCLAERLTPKNIKPKYSQAEIDFAAKLGAEQITDEERSRLELATLTRNFRWRQELLKSSLTAPQVADLLNTTRQTPHDRLKKNSLIAVQDNGVWKFPTWQFDPEGPDGVVTGLPDVLKALKVPAFSKISWLTRPNRGLNGLTPIEALKFGQINDVIAEARTVSVL
ncbi:MULTISPECIES: DUF2384 domain-containing protein [Calothrix]|uniref:DUF2384 domain-containing protein n=2 Tax=Calothrix TaxID=1186 RepID=A0ABR8A623_9CYAN|nr:MULTISPECIES: DUF2384 domain-containing protein [Calothrix]MBD2195253.1 DUF2384 domain-containing protein [Calothrix parietina FACHB-288]MBD2223776.1 DUF2384 domain-containing protein [Calothrix anomala FACHB-343]